MPTATRARVVDASAIAALLFNEPQAESIAEQIDSKELIAPALLWYELDNVYLKKIQGYPMQVGALRASLALLPELHIEGLDVDHGALVELAEKWRLTAYDASYLWLAQSRQCPLITLDKLLLKAVKKAGLD